MRTYPTKHVVYAINCRERKHIFFVQPPVGRLFLDRPKLLKGNIERWGLTSKDGFLARQLLARLGPVWLNCSAKCSALAVWS